MCLGGGHNKNGKQPTTFRDGVRLVPPHFVFASGRKCDCSWIAWRGNHVPHEDGFVPLCLLSRVLPTCPVASRNWHKACSIERKGRSCLTTKKGNSTRPQGVCCSVSSHAPSDKTIQQLRRKPAQYTSKKKTPTRLCLTLLDRSKLTEKRARHSTQQCRPPDRHTSMPAGCLATKLSLKQASSRYHALCKITIPVMRRSVCRRRRNCWTWNAPLEGEDEDADVDLHPVQRA